MGTNRPKNNNGNEIFKTSSLIKKPLLNSYALEKYPGVFRLIQRDLAGTWEKCRRVLAKVGTGPLDPVEELGQSLPLTFEGQATGP